MKYIALVSIFLIIATSLLAQDRVFAYTYQSNVLNKGDFDLEFQNTLLTGKSGSYSPFVFGQRLNQRLEFEFGLGKNIQTAFYFNSELFHFADSSSIELKQEQKISFSNEWKWKLSDPVANAIGCGLYGEIEIGGSNVEFESKLLLDKRLPNDLIAFNLAGKYEIEREILRADNITKALLVHNSAVELYFGYMHFFRPDFSLGIEAKNNNQITQDNGWINSVIFAGPAMHVSTGKCFVLLSILPQIGNIRKTDEVPGSHDYSNFEKVEFRVLAGYNF